ncbi:PREDICTED: agamous-like MADS-box protein AGL80 [Ipomoea nil]|uniref:agamous-like MADS-box protein AGL80 n=1 Tax=Ipomoea nil TaxID=35883 RepID=UPI000901BD1F|nr:PREDICTED: agamous-like MADS-box protein AGL80 [Ipomoea nil]
MRRIGRRVRLGFMVNKTQRKSSYEKQKKSMLNMLNELSILCGVEAGAILYSRFEEGPVVWPSVEDMEESIGRFLEKRFEKLGTQLLNLKRVNRETEMGLAMYQILQGYQLNNSLSFIDLNDLGWVINTYLAEIDNKVKVEAIINNSSIILASSALAPTQ